MQCLLWKVFRLKVETPRAVLDLVFLLSEVHTNQFKEGRSTTTSIMDLLARCPSGRIFRVSETSNILYTQWMLEICPSASSHHQFVRWCTDSECF